MSLVNQGLTVNHYCDETRKMQNTIPECTRQNISSRDRKIIIQFYQGPEETLSGVQHTVLITVVQEK